MNKFLLVILFLASSISFATNKEDKADLDISSMIIHHISDSHEFHIAGDLSFALPIILWTEKGLVSFMSSEFHHNDDGSIIVEKDGQQFIKFHGKIYYANEKGGITLDESLHPINSKPLDFSITKNVFSMLLSIVILFFLLFKTANYYKRKGTAVAPRGISAFIETHYTVCKR